MSLDLVLMLSVAVVGGLLAHLLRLPPLVGFLVAGFVLAGLGVTSTPALDTLADLGVVLLLFAIGLKFDVRVLGRREVLGVSVLHAVLSIGLVLGLLAVAGAAGAGLLADVEGTDLVLVSLALSFSSTVVAVKVLEEQNATRSLHGRTTIGILVVQDLVAVAALVVVGGETPRWWAPLLLLLVPASWPARRVLARIDHGELLTLVGVTLALVPGYALFDAAGLKGDLGALAVGVLLAPSARAEEVAKSVFSVKELLLVAFFLSVGLHGAPDASGIVLAVALVALVPVKAALFALLLRASGFRVRTASGVAPAAGPDAPAPRGASRRPAARRCPRARDGEVGPGGQQPAHRGLRPARDRCRLRPRACRTPVRRRPPRRGGRRDRPPLLGARVTDEGTVRLVVLAMPFHGSNLAALEQLRRSGFGGSVTAVTRYDEEEAQLSERAAVVGLYEAAGAELADRAVRTAGPGLS